MVVSRVLGGELRARVQVLMPGFFRALRFIGPEPLSRFAGSLRRRLIVIAVACLLWRGGDLRADVIVLRNGQTYAGVVERLTSQSAEIYDGNLRRVVANVDIAKVIRDRPDTSWVIVGDRMIEHGDWDAADAAYRHALETTEQPDVVFHRLERVKALRFRLPGADRAEQLWGSGQLTGAAQAFFALARRAKTAAPQHYWTQRLADVYAALAAQRVTSATTELDPYLIYALAIAPDCASAHAVLGEHLRSWDCTKAARYEFLLALDLDPTEERARAGLAAQGQTWAFSAARTDRSGLLGWVEGVSPMAPGDSPPLTKAELGRIIEQRVSRMRSDPVRLLLAAYLLEPTSALSYEGALPYPGYREIIPQLLKESRQTTATTSYDKTIIRTALTVRIDPRLMRAIARVRSDFRPEHASADGERGMVPLSRVQWQIAASLAGKDWSFAKDAGDWEKSVALGCRYLDWLRNEVLRPYVSGRLDNLMSIQAE